MSPYLSSAPNLKLIADLTSLTVSRPTTGVTNTCSDPNNFIPTEKPIASVNPNNVFNPDSEMIGEYYTTIHSLCFKSIGDLLPPKQKAPENLSGKLTKIQYLIRGTILLIKDKFRLIKYYSD